MKAVLTSIVGLLVVVLGELLAFDVYANKDQGGFWNGFFGILAFLFILFGIIMMLYFPLNSIGKLEESFNNRSKWLKNSVGMLVITLFFTPFAIAVIVFYHFTGAYHDQQLKDHGKVTKVYIEQEIIGFRSRHDLCFRFWYEDKEWDLMLDHWEYEVGDSVDIIFSTENPNEIEWYQKYLLESQEEL